jgi:poly(A) polymerase
MTDRTSTTRRFDIPKAIREIDDAFTANGYTFWLVGGYVRDLLMERHGMDVDATTNAEPQVIKHILRQHIPLQAMYEVGAKYGTIACRYKGFEFEITTYRADEYSTGSRHPQVTFGKSLDQDLDRRDFTINSLAYSPYTDLLVDLHGGRDDILYRTIRGVGNVRHRFEEDPLRMLRAVRLGAQLGFTIEAATWLAIKDQAHLVQDLSWERVRDELLKIILSNDPHNGFYNLFMSGLMELVLPEVAQTVGVTQRGPHHNADVFTHTLGVVENMPPEATVRLAALFHDTGKPATRGESLEGNLVRDTFYGHEQVSAKLARQALRRLRFPTEIVEKVTHICRMHMRPLQLYNNWPPTRRAIRRFIRDCTDNGVTFEDILRLNIADVKGHTNCDLTNTYALLDMCRQEESITNVSSAKSPLDGSEIMGAYGIGPGAHIGELKRFLLNAIVDGDIPENDKEAAWTLADTWMDSNYYRS